MSRRGLGLGLNRQRYGALLFLLLSLFYGWQIPDIQQLPVDRMEVMNARSLPWFLAGTGVLLSMLLLIVDMLQPQHSGESTPARSVRDTLSAAALLLWTFCFAFLLGVAGFWLAVSLFLFGGFLLLGERRVWFAALVAAGSGTVLYLLLKFGLDLYLPVGTLWQRLVGDV